MFSVNSNNINNDSRNSSVVIVIAVMEGIAIVVAILLLEVA